MILKLLIGIIAIVVTFVFGFLALYVFSKDNKVKVSNRQDICFFIMQIALSIVSTMFFLYVCPAIIRWIGVIWNDIINKIR